CTQPFRRDGGGRAGRAPRQRDRLRAGDEPRAAGAFAHGRAGGGRRRGPRRSAVRLALAAALALAPGAALAHAPARMVILTLPTGYYLAGAAAAVALTALVAALAPRLPAPRAHRLLERPVRVPRAASSWAACLALWALVAVGFWGSRDPLHNLLVLTVW